MEPDSDQAAAKQRRASVFRRGQKSELFADAQSLDERSELEHKLDDLHAVWALERAGHDFAAAIWRPDLALAEVVLQKGKLLTHMGVTRGNRLFLCIEEAVFLLDRANLLLFLEEGGGGGGARCRPPQQPVQRLLSLAEAHELMATAGVTLERYLVFCKLLRAGYIVQRHPARWQLKPGEDAARLWAGWGCPPPGAAGGEQGQQQQQQQQPEQQQGARQPTPPPPQPAALAAVPPAAPRAKRAKVEHADPAPRWWVSQAPPQQQQQADCGASTPGDPAGSGSSAPSTNPWMRGMPAGFLDALPRCEVLQGGAQSARDDFPLMVPLQPIPLAELQPAAALDGRHLLHYDVFASNSRFSRKAPGAPICVVSVLPCTRPPSPADMAAADAAAGGLPVRFSTVEHGDVCFYGLSHVELRSLVPGG